MNRVVLITGASSGIGKACAERLADEGDRVYGTSRHPGQEATGSWPRLITMDVDDDESVAAAVEEVVQAQGQLDVVVNNAGFGIAGAVEDTSIEEAKALFETNLFGVMRVCRAVLPLMRERRQGTIVNISSLGGRIGLPYQGLYSATKFALEGLTEALRMEVQSFGIKVVLIEPGDFRTGFTDNRLYAALARERSPYQEGFKRTIRVVESDERNGSSPEEIGRLLTRILSRSSPRARYSAGGLSQRAAAVLKGLLPSRTFEWMLMKYYKVL